MQYLCPEKISQNTKSCYIVLIIYHKVLISETFFTLYPITNK
jgi:hypothetical protein